jgi:hypothetical protein
MEKKAQNISLIDLMKLPKDYVSENIMPSRGNHITKDFDFKTNWQYCKDYYGDDFNFQLIEIDRDIHNVWLPDLISCKYIWLQYFKNNESYDLFKLIWVLDEYITHGWKYPVQAVYNWKMDWIEIHPGFLRGLVYNILNIKKFKAWYQPMTDKQFDYIHKFTDSDTLLDTMGYRDYHHLDAELITYFDRPMIKLCIHVSNITDSANEYLNIFCNNLNNGVNIICDNIVKMEIHDWPDHDIKKKIFFNRPELPTLFVDDITDLYVKLLFVGTNQFNK